MFEGDWELFDGSQQFRGRWSIDYRSEWAKDEAHTHRETKVESVRRVMSRSVDEVHLCVCVCGLAPIEQPFLPLFSRRSTAPPRSFQTGRAETFLTLHTHIKINYICVVAGKHENGDVKSFSLHITRPSRVHVCVQSSDGWFFCRRSMEFNAS